MRLSALALLPLVPAALGCAGTVSGPTETGDAEAATTTSAVVAVERTISSAEGARAEASARFIRVTAPASTEDALRAIDAALDLPARGTCESLASLAAVTRPGEPATVIELVDVGAVSLEAAGAETRLAPRQLPDVTDVVSGIVYARAGDPLLLPPAARYVLHVAGGRGIEPFDVAASAPADPSDVTILGEDEQGALVASGSIVDLAWMPDAADDVVYADVKPNDVRCVLAGAAREGSNDAVLHASLSTLLFDDAGTLVVHRLHREPLRARGVDAGEIRFDFARSVAYIRQ